MTTFSLSREQSGAATPCFQVWGQGAVGCQAHSILFLLCFNMNHVILPSVFCSF